MQSIKNFRIKKFSQKAVPLNEIFVCFRRLGSSDFITFYEIDS